MAKLSFSAAVKPKTLGVNLRHDYSETRVAVSRRHSPKVDATIRERRPCTKLTGPQELWFRSKACACGNTQSTRLYSLRKNSILPLVLKGHGFSRADKVNKISVGFSHRGTHFRIFGEIQPFSAAFQAMPFRTLLGLVRDLPAIALQGFAEPVLTCVASLWDQSGIA